MIGGFRYYGLKGLGVGILLSGSFDWLSVWLISVLRYGFRYSRRVWTLLSMQFPMLVAMLLVCLLADGWVYVLLGVVVMAWSAMFSLRFLYRNTDLIHRLLVKLKRRG